MLPVADARTIAPRVDGTLLVSRMKETRRDELKESAELVRKVGGRVLGVVLNAVQMDMSGNDYAYYDSEIRARKRAGV
jgi:Mrp family chromosome partitioning ATPase